MYSAEMTMKIMEWRRRAALPDTDPEHLSIKEMREAVEVMREGRLAAATASTKSKTAKAEAKAPVNTGALLQGLMKKGE